MELDDLYQEMILDHYKRPRNFGVIEHPDLHAEGHNPLCGDRLSLDVSLRDGVIADSRFQGSGCAISTASASLMTEAVKGKTPAQVDALYRTFHAAATGGAPPADAVPLGKLQVFGNVSRYPARVKCATLAWHTLKAALDGQSGKVSTE
jgi:nitrogen fixation NifU-like protein